MICQGIEDGRWASPARDPLALNSVQKNNALAKRNERTDVPHSHMDAGLPVFSFLDGLQFVPEARQIGHSSSGWLSLLPRFQTIRDENLRAHP